MWIDRRDALRRIGGGFGTVGMLGALNAAGALRAADVPDADGSGASESTRHFPARAKRVIFLFMNGGPSHVDTFDPKPRLAQHEGEAPPGETERNQKTSGLMPSPFRFAKHGQSGMEISELFPRLSRCADDLCLLRSMHTDVPNHEPGLLIMHSGHQQPTRPCLGSWASYGLGTENENLPAFVTLAPGMPVVGPQLWSNAFLPGEHQAVSVDTSDMTVEKMMAHLQHPTLGRDEQRRQLEVLQQLNAIDRDRHAGEAAMDAHIRSLELAFQMQRDAEEAFDIHRESAATVEAYGDSEFGRSCLLARRLSERGVRFVQVYYVGKNAKQPWDTHAKNNERHETLCADSDRATAALLTDLKQRGMLEDTLVVWGGEFGRTPYSQIDKNNKKKKAGRDHHHTGFSMLMAGGGVRGGLTHGATDEFGMHAVENRVHVHDLHATILHLMGIDHKRLTYRYSGRDYRLTDVHGRVVQDVIA